MAFEQSRNQSMLFYSILRAANIELLSSQIPVSVDDLSLTMFPIKPLFKQENNAYRLQTLITACAPFFVISFCDTLTYNPIACTVCKASNICMGGPTSSRLSMYFSVRVANPIHGSIGT